MAKNNKELGAAFTSLARDSSNLSKKIAKKEPLPDLTGLVGSDSHYQVLSIYDLEDAPEAWNMYPRIKDVNSESYLEIKSSIAKNGVLDAPRVWQQDNGSYMIISGHNRKDISLELIQEYPENKDKWENITCYVLGKDEVTEEQVRAEIHDTNIHRNWNDIDKRTQMLILDDRIAYLMGNKTPKGEDVLILAEKMGIKKTKMYDQLSIRNDLIPEIKELYFDCVLPTNMAVKIASLNVEVQEYLYNNYKDKLDAKTVANMPKDVFSKGLASSAKYVIIDDYFVTLSKTAAKPTKKITYSIPADREEEFRKLVEEFLKKSV